MNKIVEELRDVIEEGLRNDIFRAERAKAVYQEIAKNSDEINSSNEHKKRLLAYLQSLTINEAILATTKLYDQVNNYPTRSINLLLKLLKDNADKFPEVGQKSNTKKELSQLNTPKFIIDKVDSSDLSEFPRYFSHHYLSLIWDPQTEKLLNEIKTFRDKKVAHNERTTDKLSFEWKSINQLLSLPKQIVGVLGWAYLNTVYMHNNNYKLSFDAQKLTASIKGTIGQEI